MDEAQRVTRGRPLVTLLAESSEHLIRRGPHVVAERNHRAEVLRHHDTDHLLRRIHPEIRGCGTGPAQLAASSQALRLTEVGHHAYAQSPTVPRERADAD